MKSLNCRTGAGDPSLLVPNVFLYVWGTHGLRRALDDARDEIALINPGAIILHAGPRELARELESCVMDVRERHSSVRVSVGVGLDGTVGDWRDGDRTAEQVIDPLVKVARICEKLKVQMIVWNGETEWKDSPNDRVTASQIQQLAHDTAVAVTAAAPSVIHALSSFAQPNYHATLAAFLRGFTPHMSVFSGQAYVAVKGGAAKGALPHTLDVAARAQEIAEREGWLPDDVTTVDVHTDCDRIPTVQSHQTPLADLARACAELDHVFVWSVPTVAEGGRTDAAGLQALRFALIARRAGMSIRQWQQSRGLTADGIVGPLTLATAGV